MTFYINGRSVVHRGSGGKVITTSINLTGEEKTPVPYQNIALSAHARNTARGFLCNQQAICHVQSYFSKSRGDEAGFYGGIISGTVNGKAEFITASPNCVTQTGMFLNGIAVARAGDLMVSNQRNTPPAPLIQAITTKTSFAYDSSWRNTSSHTVIEFKIKTLLTTPQLAQWWVVKSKQNVVYPLWHDGQFYVPDMSTDLKLAIASTGGAIQIPITALQPPMTIEQFQAVEVKCAWKVQVPADQSLMELLSYPDFARELVYQQLISSPQTDTWHQQLTPSQRHFLKSLDVPQVLSGGFLYCYLNGNIWREFVVNSRGELVEVDLSIYQGKDQRKATGLPMPTCILVLAIHQVNTECALAFSPVAWSWSRIQSFSGQAFRQSKRLQAIDVDSLQQMMDSQSPRKRNGCKAIPSYLLAPIVFVANHFGLLDRLIADFNFLIRDLNQRLEASSTVSEFELALLIRRVFWSDKRWLNLILVRQTLHLDQVERLQDLLIQNQSVLVSVFNQIPMIAWQDYFERDYNQGFEKVVICLVLACLDWQALGYCPSQHDPPGYQLMQDLIDTELATVIFTPNGLVDHAFIASLSLLSLLINSKLKQAQLIWQQKFAVLTQPWLKLNTMSNWNQTLGKRIGSYFSVHNKIYSSMGKRFLESIHLKNIVNFVHLNQIHNWSHWRKGFIDTRSVDWDSDIKTILLQCLWKEQLNDVYPLADLMDDQLAKIRCWPLSPIAELRISVIQRLLPSLASCKQAALNRWLQSNYYSWDRETQHGLLDLLRLVLQPVVIKRSRISLHIPYYHQFSTYELRSGESFTEKILNEELVITFHSAPSQIQISLSDKRLRCEFNYTLPLN